MQAYRGPLLHTLRSSPSGTSAVTVVAMLVEQHNRTVAESSTQLGRDGEPRAVVPLWFLSVIKDPAIIPVLVRADQDPVHRPR